MGRADEVRSIRLSRQLGHPSGTSLVSGFRLTAKECHHGVLPVRLSMRMFSRSRITTEGHRRVRYVKPMVECLEDRLTPAPIMVTSATDNGTGQNGTLSAAIMQANTNPGSTIAFNIQGTSTIQVTGVLPSILAAVTINGYSQGGPTATPGVPYVELHGPGAGGFNGDGLDINAAGGVVIQGLAIDNFNGDGISLQGNNSTIQACFIGTDLSGMTPGIGNLVNGIVITGGNNTNGGSVPATGNLISGNRADGINIQNGGADGNVIARNVIGLDVTQTILLPNQFDGIRIISQANYNTIGGLDTSAVTSNVISGNGQNGVEISNAIGTEIGQNYIGVAYGGSTAFGNTLNGVLLENDTELTLVGSAAAGVGNVISGNGGDGVLVNSPIQQAFDTANEIDNNYIGVAGDGVTRVQNGANGIEIDSVVDTRIINDVISGNSGDGVLIESTGAAAINTDISVSGSMIGTNAAGTAAIGNGLEGVAIINANGNTIGAATQGTPQNPNVPSNVISGNSYYGIEIGGSSNLVVNDYIGTNLTGTQGIPNQWGGVNIGWSRRDPASPPNTVVAANNTIGGTGGLNATRNVISGNGFATTQGGYGNGISLYGAGVQGTVVQGNYIGLDATGLVALGNADYGIAIGQAIAAGNSPTNTTIGGPAAGAGNVISANGAKPGYNTNGLGYGVDADGTGLLQNNTIGFDMNGQNPQRLRNQGGGVTGVANWTVMGNTVQP